MSDREKLIDKIRKLRTKGADGAVTEAEANAFLNAAARLMADHGVNDEHLAKAGIEVGVIEKKGVHVSLHKAHPAVFAIDAIGKLTGTSIGMRVTTVPLPKGGWREIGGLTISGRPADREIAEYLYDQVRNLIDAAWKAERRRRIDRIRSALGSEHAELETHPEVQEFVAKWGLGVGHKARRSFGFGMAYRLADRIEKMATRQAESETALTVWRERCDIDDDKKPPRPLDLDLASYRDGAIAGKDASLGDGVSAGQGSTLKLAVRQ